MSTPYLKQHDSGYYYAYWSVDRRAKKISLATKDRAEAEQRLADFIRSGLHVPNEDR